MTKLYIDDKPFIDKAKAIFKKYPVYCISGLIGTFFMLIFCSIIILILLIVMIGKMGDMGYSHNLTGKWISETSDRTYTLFINDNNGQITGNYEVSDHGGLEDFLGLFIHQECPIKGTFYNDRLDIHIKIGFINGPANYNYESGNLLDIHDNNKTYIKQ